MRLIACRVCYTTEVIPDALDPNPEHDPLLLRIHERHRGPLDRQQLRGRPAGAPRLGEIAEGEGHFPFDIFLIDNDVWNNPDENRRDTIRHQILKQIWGEGTGFPDSFYEARDTFFEDAGYCYNRHNRPGSERGPHACVDYEDDSKRLTDREWQQRGADAGITREHVYLCTWCPYSSVVMVRRRTSRGDYDN